MATINVAKFKWWGSDVYEPGKRFTVHLLHVDHPSAMTHDYVLRVETDGSFRAHRTHRTVQLPHKFACALLAAAIRDEVIPVTRHHDNSETHNEPRPSHPSP